VKQRIRSVARAAEAAARTAAEQGQTGTVNTSVRRNVQVRVNVGSDDGMQTVSATQYAPIRQGPDQD